MNHKRRRPKKQRAGCLICKPHKGNGQSGLWAKRPGQMRADATDREERRAA